MISTRDVEAFNPLKLPYTEVKQHPEWGLVFSVPNSAGIYFLVKDCQLHYIGTSKRISSRLRDKGHFRFQSMVKRFGEFRIYYWEQDEDRGIWEKKLVRRFRPPLNWLKFSGTFPEYTEQNWLAGMFDMDNLKECMETCPLCNGTGRGKIKQEGTNIIAIAPCPICENGMVDEVGMNRYRLCRDLMRQEEENKVKDFPLHDPDLPWDV